MENIKVEGNTAYFTLANGEMVQVVLHSDGRLQLYANYELLIKPVAGNSVLVAATNSHSSFDRMFGRK